ncbi:HAMP domain-containing histidine kinase [Myxococcota bacterium]|nr:HAMP domain-containing histidine kinase [Myxococcota bacterium]
MRRDEEISAPGVPELASGVAKGLEEQLGLGFVCCPDAMALIEPGGRVLCSNDAARRVGVAGDLGVLVGGSARLAVLLSGEPPLVGRSTGRLPDGRVLSLSVARAPESLAAGALLVTIHELGQALSDEEERAASQYGVALASVSAAVANEVNNPLAVILGRVELIRAVHLAETPALDAQLSVVADHAERIASVVRSLLTLGRPSGLGRERIVVAPMVERVVESVRRRIGQADVSLGVVNPGAVVVGDREQLEQIVSAFLLCSPSVVQRRGRVELRVFVTEGALRLELHDNARATIRGMQELARSMANGALEPIPGVGLSLLAAAWCVRQHGGRVLPPEANTRGHTVIIELPVAEPRPAARASTSLLIVAPGTDLLNEVRGLINADGVELRTAGSADHALREIELERPDAVLTAAQVAGRSGLLLRRQITRRWSALERKVAIVHDNEQPDIPGVVVLTRPLSRDALLRFLSG